MTKSIKSHISLNFLCRISLQGCLSAWRIRQGGINLYYCISDIFSLHVHYSALMQTRCWARCDQKDRSILPEPISKNIPLFLSNPGYLYFSTGSWTPEMLSEVLWIGWQDSLRTQNVHLLGKFAHVQYVVHQRKEILPHVRVPGKDTGVDARRGRISSLNPKALVPFPYLG